MSEQILKLQPTNSYGETAKPGAFINSKLLDFTIPGNSTYDLSKSYIALNMSALPTANVAGAPAGVLDTDTALYSQEIVLQVGANPATPGAAPIVGQYQSALCASLVRNAQMFSQNRGMVESIRRVDTLRQILYNLENDKKEIEDNLNSFGTLQGRRGIGNRTTSLHHTVTNNTNSSGQVDLAHKSYGIARDFRIPLSDLFGVGNAMWNGLVYGDTRINLELNINKLYLLQLGGAESTSISNDSVNTWGACEDQTIPINSDATELVLTTDYDDVGLNMPFHVGQSIVVNGTSDNTPGTGVQSVSAGTLGAGYTVGGTGVLGGAGGNQTATYEVTTIDGNGVPTGVNVTAPGSGYTVGEVLALDGADGSPGAARVTILTLTAAAPGPIATKRVIIDSIKYDALTKVTLTTRTSWHTTGGVLEAISDLKIDADVANILTSQIRIHNAEIVLSQMPGVNGPSEIDYRTYSTEEQSGNAQPVYFHQYTIEPQAQNLIVAHCNPGEIACQREWLDYRLAINNVDVTGNRSVRYAQNLHQDRVLRFMNNRGQNISNLSFRSLDNVATQSTNQIEVFPICETLPIRPEPKIVTLNLEANPAGQTATTIGDVIMYKELIKTI